VASPAFSPLNAAGALHPRAWQSNLAGAITGVLAGLFYAIYSLMGRSAA
jgi:threonine/homoserine efflux transporter RhtA